MTSWHLRQAQALHTRRRWEAMIANDFHYPPAFNGWKLPLATLIINQNDTQNPPQYS
jgi:hypothetical protein